MDRLFNKICLFLNVPLLLKCQIEHMRFCKSRNLLLHWLYLLPCPNFHSSTCYVVSAIIKGCRNHQKKKKNTPITMIICIEVTYRCTGLFYYYYFNMWEKKKKMSFFALNRNWYLGLRYLSKLSTWMFLPLEYIFKQLSL